MKNNLYYCPLCEKNRVERKFPTVWECKSCQVLFELTQYIYKAAGENEKAVITFTYTLTDAQENEGERDGEFDPRKPI